MQLHGLQRNTKRSTSRRIGRGGKRGKTSGRGTKGQRARAGHRMRPEMRDIIKKLPKRRGFGKNRARGVRSGRVEPVTINLRSLGKIEFSGTITPSFLVENALIPRQSGRIPSVKILSVGSLTRPLTFSGFQYSSAAREKIQKAGGTIVE